MKNDELNTLREAWKKERSFQENALSETDIKKYLGQRSRDISRLFQAGIITDMVMKTLLGLSFAGLFFLMPNHTGITMYSAALLVLIILLMIYQWGSLKRIPASADKTENLRDLLEMKITYYRQRHLKSLHIAALSGSLFFLSGMIYYFYFKYGEIRPLDVTDLLVFSTAVLVAYVTGVIIQMKSHGFYIRQLEHCLAEIDENAIKELTIQRQKHQRRRLFFIILLALVAGLLLFTYLAV